MNNNSKTDLTKHVSRVVRSMKLRKIVSGGASAGVSDCTPKETESESLSSTEADSSHVGTEGYPSWLEQL